MERITPTRAVDAAANQLRRAILEGDYGPGDALPPERELATRLGISRLTLRSSLAKLEAEGLVAARQGSGVRVLDWRETGTVALLWHLLREGNEVLRSFLALRRALAAEAIAEAARVATEADVRLLGALADAQASRTNPEDFAAGDLAFTRAVVRVAGNVPMELLLNSVVAVLAVRPELSLAMNADRSAVLASYRVLMSLIDAGDPEAARTTVRALLETLDAATERRFFEAPT